MKDNSRKSGVRKTSGKRQTKGKQSISLSYLEEMAGGNREFMNEVTQLFIDEIPAFCKRMQTSVKNEDYGSLKLTVHKLKSSVLIYGREDMANLTVKIGEYVTEEKHQLIPQLTKTLIVQLTALKKALERLMPIR